MLLLKGAKIQTNVNSATDIVVLGDVDREKDWASSSKKALLDMQVAVGAGRKRALHVLPFDAFVQQYGMEHDVRHNASIAEFREGVPPPGAERSRGTCFPRTLQ